MTESSREPLRPVPSSEHPVHVLPPRRSAYRRWFSRLHPSLQLVLMQLWMPVFMCLMFVLCYIAAFQHVAPRHVPVGVIADTATVAQLQQGAEKAAPGAFDFSPVPDAATAREEVRSGRYGAVMDPAERSIMVAGAHQNQAATLLPTLLTPLFGDGAAPTKDDVAPLPTGDIGMTPMYLMLTWCITGYLAAMFIGLMGGPLRRVTRFAVIFGAAAFLTLLATVLVDPVLGAIRGHFWALWGLGFCWAVAIGFTVNGLSYFMSRFIAAPAMTIFIFLSIPSSGAAMPQWLMPEPFRWLNHVVVGSGITEMLKRLIYDVGPGYGRGWRMLACYAVIGLALTLIGKPYWEHRRVKALASGRTTMFQDAQRANGRRNQTENTQILAAHGLTVREEDGAILRIPRQRVHEQREQRRSRGTGLPEREAELSQERGIRARDALDPGPSPMTGVLGVGLLERELNDDEARPARAPRHRAPESGSDAASAAGMDGEAGAGPQQ